MIFSWLVLSRGSPAATLLLLSPVTPAWVASAAESKWLDWGRWPCLGGVASHLLAPEDPLLGAKGLAGPGAAGEALLSGPHFGDLGAAGQPRLGSECTAGWSLPQAPCSGRVLGEDKGDVNVLMLVSEAEGFREPGAPRGGLPSSTLWGDWGAAAVF